MAAGHSHIHPASWFIRALGVSQLCREVLFYGFPLVAEAMQPIWGGQSPLFMVLPPLACFWRDFLPIQSGRPYTEGRGPVYGQRSNTRSPARNAFSDTYVISSVVLSTIPSTSHLAFISTMLPRLETLPTSQTDSAPLTWPFSIT